MFSDWHSALKRLALGFVVLLLAGWLLGAPALVLLLGTGGYLIYHLLQLRKLYSWLRNYEDSDPVPPPESRGIWGYVFDGIYLLQRRERDALLDLRSIMTRPRSQPLHWKWPWS